MQAMADRFSRPFLSLRSMQRRRTEAIFPIQHMESLHWSIAGQPVDVEAQLSLSCNTISFSQLLMQLRDQISYRVLLLAKRK